PRSLRWRAALRRCAQAHRRARSRHRHLPARPRGPWHRAGTQARRLQPPGPRPRHGRRQPRARAPGRQPRVRHRRADPRGSRRAPHAADDQQPREVRRAPGLRPRDRRACVACSTPHAGEHRVPRDEAPSDGTSPRMPDQLTSETVAGFEPRSDAVVDDEPRPSARMLAAGALRTLGPRRIRAVYLWVGFLILFALLKPGVYLTSVTIRLIFSEGAVTCLVALAFLIPLVAGA